MINRDFFEAAKRRATASPVCLRAANLAAGRERYRDEPARRREALAFSDAIAAEPVVIHPFEQVSGIFYCGEGCFDSSYRDAMFAMFDRLPSELPEYYALCGDTGGSGEPKLDESATLAWAMCCPCHVGWRWDRIVERGVEGVLADIAAAKKGADPEGLENLENMEIALHGVLRWTDAYVAEFTRRLAASTDAAECAWLRERIECCTQVPRRGARNFREAVQAFQFAYLACQFDTPGGGSSPGWLDHYLRPWFERDFATGAITREQAASLVEELFIRFQERLCWGMDGWVETVVLGGGNVDGKCTANLLTEIMVEVYCGLEGITHPAVYLRMPSDAPEWLWKLALDYVKRGGNRAQLVNDAAVMATLTAGGEMSRADANDYMCNGCMELTSFGRSSDMVFTNFFNVAKVLEYVVTGGRCLKTGKQLYTHLGRGLADYADFEAFYGAFARELERTLGVLFRSNEIGVQEWERFRPGFLASALIDDCIARGRTFDGGGARYNGFGSTPLGIPNAADSLNAIRIAVFEEKFIAPEALVAALTADFAGLEPLRRRLAALPKYGSGDSAADAMATRVATTVCDIYEARRNSFGGPFKPMIMTFMMAPVEGRKVGATPDGRHSGTPLAQGITPQTAGMTAGMGQAMRSAAGLPIARFTGGASHMWDLDRSIQQPEIMRPLLETFFTLGGQMFQGNTVNSEKLRDAQKHPENHPDLTVRVGGYSAVFIDLAACNQDEILSRFFHDRT